MFRPPPCHSVLLRSFASPRPAFSHGRRFYAQLKVDKTAEDFNKLSTDEQLERLTKLNASADNNPDVDLWSLNADLLGRWFDTACTLRIRPITFKTVDLHVPEPVIRATGASLSLRTRTSNFFANQINHFKNIFRSVWRGHMTPPASRPWLITDIPACTGWPRPVHCPVWTHPNPFA